MTVTVTGVVQNVAGKPDRSKWVFSSQLRQSGDGDSIVSPTLDVATPNAEGLLTVELDPGPVIVKYGNTTVVVTVPDVASYDLWDLIGATVLLPPTTTDQKLIAAFDAYIEAHPPVENGDGTVTFAGASVVSSADPVKARAKIGAASTTSVTDGDAATLMSATGRAIAFSIALG